MDRRPETGRAGEALVARHLVAEGFEIVDRNVRVGRLEIDLIARRGTLLLFVEVRSRRRADPVHPAFTFGAAKRRRVRRAARRWLMDNGAPGMRVRLDAAAVVLAGPTLDYYEDVF